MQTSFEDMLCVMRVICVVISFAEDVSTVHVFSVQLATDANEGAESTIKNKMNAKSAFFWNIDDYLFITT